MKQITKETKKNSTQFLLICVMEAMDSTVFLEVVDKVGNSDDRE